MCQTTTLRAVCPTCSKELSTQSNTQWCREASRKGTYGRCLIGVREKEEECQGIDCEKCLEKQEAEAVDQDLREAVEKAGYGW